MKNAGAGDHRGWATVGLIIAGAVIVALTAVLTGDAVAEVALGGVYGIGWSFVTFGFLYWLSGKFEDMKWGRPDHDLVKRFDDAVQDDEEPT